MNKRNRNVCCFSMRSEFSPFSIKNSCIREEEKCVCIENSRCVPTDTRPKSRVEISRQIAHRFDIFPFLSPAKYNKNRHSGITYIAGCLFLFTFPFHQHLFYSICRYFIHIYMHFLRCTTHHSTSTFIIIIIYICLKQHSLDAGLSISTQLELCTLRRSIIIGVSMYSVVGILVYVPELLRN